MTSTETISPTPTDDAEDVGRSHRSPGRASDGSATGAVVTAPFRTAAPGTASPIAAGGPDGNDPNAGRSDNDGPHSNDPNAGRSNKDRPDSSDPNAGGSIRGSRDTDGPNDGDPSNGASDTDGPTDGGPDTARPTDGGLHSGGPDTDDSAHSSTTGPSVRIARTRTRRTILRRSRDRRPPALCHVGDDSGMSTVEYAIGTVAAAAFAAVLYAVVSGDSILGALTGIVQRALSTTF